MLSSLNKSSISKSFSTSRMQLRTLKQNYENAQDVQNYCYKHNLNILDYINKSKMRSKSIL